LTLYGHEQLFSLLRCPKDRNLKEKGQKDRREPPKMHVPGEKLK